MKKLYLVAPRVVVFDPLDEYRSVARPDLVCDNAFEFLDYFDAKGGEGNFKISFQGGTSSETQREHIDAIFKFSWSLGNVLIIIDEADIFISEKNRYFDHLIEQGRHRNVSLCCGVRRTPEVKTNYRAQLTSLFTFFQDQPMDLQHLQDWGFSPEGIANLRPVSKEEYPEAREGVHYLVIGEKFEEIRFEKADYMTPKTRMEF